MVDEEKDKKMMKGIVDAISLGNKESADVEKEAGMKGIMDAIGTGKTAEAESKDTHLKSVVDAIGSFTDVKKPTEKKPTDTK